MTNEKHAVLQEYNALFFCDLFWQVNVFLLLLYFGLICRIINKYQVKVVA